MCFLTYLPPAYNIDYVCAFVLSVMLDIAIADSFNRVADNLGAVATCVLGLIACNDAANDDLSVFMKYTKRVSCVNKHNLWFYMEFDIIQ